VTGQSESEVRSAVYERNSDLISFESVAIQVEREISFSQRKISIAPPLHTHSTIVYWTVF
jgi:hypothetical protein